MKDIETDLIVYKDDKLTITDETVKKLKTFYTLKAEMKVFEEELKSQAKLKMEELGKSSIIVEGLSIIYKKPTTKKIIDNDKLKADGLYDSYIKVSDVKGSVEIKVEL